MKTTAQPLLFWSVGCRQWPEGDRCLKKHPHRKHQVLIWGCLEVPYLLTTRVFSFYVPHFQVDLRNGMSFSQNSMPSTSSSSCSALFAIIDGTTQRRWQAWRSSSENRSCIWMIKESGSRNSYSLLVMIDWTGTYIITYIIFGMKKGETWVTRQVWKLPKGGVATPSTLPPGSASVVSADESLCLQ